MTLRPISHDLTASGILFFPLSTPCKDIIVRGLYVATGQYSSFCECALGLMLGVLDIMGVEVQNREQVEVKERTQRHQRQKKKTKQGNKKRSDM